MRGNSNLVSKSVQDQNLGDMFVRWAQQERSIRAVVIIGSRAREKGTNASSDGGSDWDFQLVTTRPGLFATGAWTASARLSKPLIYVAREGRLGRITKVTGVFTSGEIDLILLPLNGLRLGKWLLNLRLLRYFPTASRRLAELAMVLGPGYRLLKGSHGWRRFFHKIAFEITPQRLNNWDICRIADGYVSDYISTRRKITRGELLAAQRWLHCHLAETNFRLHHELKLRRNQPSYPDARRIEALGRDCWLEAVTVSVLLNAESLSDAVERSAQGCRDLMDALVGSQWRWPDLSAVIGGRDADQNGDDYHHLASHPPT
jgi:hypothetical protein